MHEIDNTLRSLCYKATQDFGSAGKVCLINEKVATLHFL